MKRLNFKHYWDYKKQEIVMVIVLPEGIYRHDDGTLASTDIKPLNLDERKQQAHLRGVYQSWGFCGLCGAVESGYFIWHSDNCKLAPLEEEMRKARMRR